MSPVAMCGTDTPLDTSNPDVNNVWTSYYVALGLILEQSRSVAGWRASGLSPKQRVH